MRCITYAGETVITTDEVARALVELTAALARTGQAEAVTIPIVSRDDDRVGEASLVVGLGNDVLSVPVEWEAEIPDADEWVRALRAHPVFPSRRPANIADLPCRDDSYDPDLDIDRA